MVFNSPCLTDKKELIHHEVEMVINSPWIMPLLGTKGLASPEQTATDRDWLQIHRLMSTIHQRISYPKSENYLFNKATKTANYMVLRMKTNLFDTISEGVLMKNKDVASSRDIQLICAEFFKYSSQDLSRLDVAAKIIFQSSRVKTEDLSRN
ncbi:hypothetical protein Tco_0591426 [Tanacetum coccineum]